MPKTGVKDLEAIQTYAAGTHGYVSNVPRSVHADTKTNADPTSFPITSR
jgi:hypothetical protein